MRLAINHDRIFISEITPSETVYRIGDNLDGWHYHNLNKSLVYIHDIETGLDVDIFTVSEFENIKPLDLEQLEMEREIEIEGGREE